MILNPDCIRDVMLTLEENLTIEKESKCVYCFKPIKPDVLACHMEERFGYSGKDVVYSALQLWESGYIATNGGFPVYDDLDMVNIGSILYITPKGHEFIAAIHNKETWNSKINPILKKLGDVSLSVIESVSKGVTDSIIEKIIAPAVHNT